MRRHNMAALRRSSDESVSLEEVSTTAPRSDPEATIDHNFSSHAHSRYSTDSGSSFTLRALLSGLAIGVLICFCNLYFGLQTGWGSGMSMPASLIAFAAFRSLSNYIKLPFTPVENVLVQTVAGSAGTMSLGCGFVGIIPAIEFILWKDEGAPISLGVGRLVLWSLGIAIFPSLLAAALRKEVIMREKLRFPGGTATALLIGVLHGNVKGNSEHGLNPPNATQDTEESHALLQDSGHYQADVATFEASDIDVEVDQLATTGPLTIRKDLRDRYVKFLIRAFLLSALYTVFSYFVPQIRDLPVLGRSMAVNWLWALNPSPAYVGQGAIMGPTTSFHMLVGAIIGWGILSPIAKSQGWAPGTIDDWEDGSKGWIMWISLALMLADSLTNLGWLVLRPLLQLQQHWIATAKGRPQHGGKWYDFFPLRKYYQRYSSPGRSSSPLASSEVIMANFHEDAPQSQQVPNTIIAILLPGALIFCVICTHLSFGPYIAFGTSTLATILALLASVMGIRATGETDLTPASGIGKLGQLLFSMMISKNNPNAIVINLLVGTILASGASQASDMMQDFKTAHLVHASPKAQFYGQLIGSVFGVIVTPLVYRLYVSVYELPSQLFQMPGAYIWIFTARLLTGRGLPPMVWQFGVVAGSITICTTILRIRLGSHKSADVRNLQRFVPGGIALAIGMYTTPSFSIPRAFGGLLSWWYMKHHGDETTVVVIASGLILGEGILSMLNLGLASMNVPHL